MANKHTRQLTGFVETLKSQKNKQSRMHIMMSEFIDNSYSSWVIDGKNKTPEGLKVEIEFNYLNDFIEIRDNAYGMNLNQLSNAIIMFKQRDEKDNYINVFGVGMKQAAFWLGGCLEIRTHNGEGTQYYTRLNLEELKEIEDETGSVTYGIDEEDVSITRGTTIRISNIHSRILGLKLKDYFRNVIGWRFNKQLSELMIIEMKKISSKSHIKKPYIGINAFSPLPDNIADWASLKKSYPDEIKEGWKSELINEIKQLSRNKQVSKEIFDMTISKINNNLPFIYDISLKVGENKIKGKIGLLSFRYNHQLNSSKVGKFKIASWPYTKMRGFTLYQSKRGIIGGPNEAGIYAYHSKELTGGGGDIFKTRIFGEFDLTGIFGVDENKRGFQWEDDNNKYIFDTQLKNEIRKYFNLFRQINIFERRVIKVKKNTGADLEKDRNLLKTTQKELFGPTFEELEVISSDDEPGIVYKNWKIGNKTIDIKLTEIESGSTLVSSRQNPDGQYIFKVNIGHKLFRNTLATTFGKTVRYELLYPLIVLVGIADLILVDENIELDSNNFIDAVNKVSQIIWDLEVNE